MAHDARPDRSAHRSAERRPDRSADRRAMRRQLLDWVEGAARVPAGPDRTRLLEGLRDDTTRLPARLRLGLSGCDLVTFAHAARLLHRLTEQGMLGGPEPVAEALRAVPPCILGDATRVVDESLRADGVIGKPSRAPA